MPISEISPCSSFESASSRSLSPERPHDLGSNVEASSSAPSDRTLTDCNNIVIALKAHEKMRMEPLAHVMRHLVGQKNCKVVVICCMSRVRSELGVDLLIDDAFRGVSKKKLEGALITQRNYLNHFLKPFKAGLDKREVQLDILVPVGSKSDDILVKAAKGLHAQWIVLDVSFSGHQKRIQAVLECNLVLMKKRDSDKPLILPLPTKKLGRVGHIHGQAPAEIVNPVLDTYCPGRRRNSISTSITPPITTGTARSNDTVTATTTTQPSVRGRDTANTAASNTNSKAESGGESGPPTPLTLSPTQVATQNAGRAFGRHPAPSLTGQVATQCLPAWGRPAPSPAQVAPQSPRAWGPPAPSPAQAAPSSPQAWNHPALSPAQVAPSSPTPREWGSPAALSSLQAPMRSPARRFSVPTIPPWNPPTAPTRFQEIAPTPPSFRTSPSKGNQSEEMQFELALAMALNASILTAAEEGIPVSQSALEQSSLWDEDRGDRLPSSDGTISNEIATITTYPTSYSWDGGRSDGKPTSHRNNADEGEFNGARLESEQRIAIERRRRLSDILSTSECRDFVESANPAQPGSPTSSSLAFSSSESFIPGVASPSTRTAPSAPPLPVDSPIRYPSVDTTPVRMDTPAVQARDTSAVRSNDVSPTEQKVASGRKGGECVVCWDSPAESICIPCGHVAGCMRCLTEVKLKNWGCPVCRVPIQQVIKVYHVV